MKNQIIQPTVIGYEEHKKSLRLLRIKFALFLLSLIIWSVFAWQYRECYEGIKEQELKLISKVIKTKTALASGITLSTEVEPQPSDIKGYILYQVAKAGLNPKEVACLVEHEGGWSETGYHVNSNRTVDVGPFQGNSVHYGKTTDIKCMTDVVCATKWFIAKRLRDGNYSQWYGYAAGHCERFK